MKEWEDARNFCHERFKISRSIEGTQKLHAFIPKSNSKLLVKPYSRSENCKEVEVATAFQGLNFGEIRGFVTVKYDNNWYVACVLDTFIDMFEVKVSFLLPAGPSKSFKYSQLSEQALLPSSDVLTLVDPSIHKRGRVYYLTDKETNDVDRAMRLKLQLQ